MTNSTPDDPVQASAGAREDQPLSLWAASGDVGNKELAFYPRQRQAYGTPLDSRSRAAKPGWAIWVATMADSKEACEDLLAPICRYVCETPNRVPIADIHLADTGRRRANQARSVVGGFFMKLLADQLARARA